MVSLEPGSKQGTDEEVIPYAALEATRALSKTDEDAIGVKYEPDANANSARSKISKTELDAQNAKYIKARQRRKAMYGWTFLAPFAVLFVVVFLIPIIVSIYKSFFRDEAGNCGPFGCEGGAVSTFVGFSNFRAAITDTGFWLGLGRVFYFGIFQIPIMILLALALAMLLDSLAAKYTKIYRMCYFLPYAIPGVIAAIVWIYLYSPDLSPIMDFLGMFGIRPEMFSGSVVLYSMANVTTWTYTGYNMLIFYAALQSVPTELYEAARMDGATEWTIVRRIKMPMLSSAALLTVLLSIIGTIQLFNEPAMFAKPATLPSNYMPMMFALNVKNNLATIDGYSGTGPASALALVMAVIAGVMALVYSLIQRKVAPSNE